MASRQEDKRGRGGEGEREKERGESAHETALLGVVDGEIRVVADELFAKVLLALELAIPTLGLALLALVLQGRLVVLVQLQVLILGGRAERFCKKEGTTSQQKKTQHKTEQEKMDREEEQEKEKG